MTYPIAEQFRAPQGEGVHTGVMTHFFRFVGCSVGQTICTHCDTDFDRIYPAWGGGKFTFEDIRGLAQGSHHICLTGGEPLDRDLRSLIDGLIKEGFYIQVETSGTKHPRWIDSLLYRTRFWLTVSPKPGYLDDMIHSASEVKVIYRGLGDGTGWPTLTDALKWADMGKKVYLQPRNGKQSVNNEALREVIDICEKYPQLHLSVQLHKLIATR